MLNKDNGSKKRENPYVRNKKAAGRMVFQERDERVLAAIRDYGMLTRKQIQRLVFGPTLAAIAKKRLRFLFDTGYVNRQLVPISRGNIASQPVYLLSVKGFAHLGIEKRRARDVGDIFIYHTLAINDVRLTFETEARAKGFVIEQWLPDAEIKGLPTHRETVQLPGEDRKVYSVPMLPDAFFMIGNIPKKEGGTHKAPFFLEVDLGNISHSRWRRRVLGYKKYIRSDNFTNRYGVKIIRILTVTDSKARMLAMKKDAEELKAGPIFWFTTLAELESKGSFDSAIWDVVGMDGLQVLVS